MVKDVVSIITQHNDGSAPAPAEPTDDDPWKGIFYVSDDEDDEDDGDFFTDDEELDADDDISFWWTRTSGAATAPSRSSWNDDDMSGSDDGNLYSDDEPRELDTDDDGESAYESEHDAGVSYVLPRWEPPTVDINPNDYPEDGRDDLLELLRRGCSWDMVQNFDIRYSDRQGIIVSLHSLDHLYASDDDDSSDDGVMGRESSHQIYLGWNIVLDEDDVDGEVYMDRVLEDIKARPERWRLIPRYDGHGSMDVKRLVPLVDVEEHSATDTDAWLNAEDHDLDVD